MSDYRFDAQHASVTVSLDEGEFDVVRHHAAHHTIRAQAGPPIRVSFTTAFPEQLVGLGERFGHLSQNGLLYEGRNTEWLHDGVEETFYYVPVVYSSAGYSVVVDSPRQAVWDLRASERQTWSVTVPDSTVDIHVFVGQGRDLVGLATGVMGRSPLAPPWMFGVWKALVSGTESVLREAELLHKERIPVTACWIEDYFDEQTNAGSHVAGSYPQGSYPDLSKMNAGLHSLGFRSLGYMQPCLVAGSSAFKEAAARGYLVKRRDGSHYLIPWWWDPYGHPGVEGPFPDGGAYLDFTNPEAAAWFRGLVAQHLSYGFDGWMQDFGEGLPNDAMMADGSTGLESHNRYALLYHQTSHAEWSKHPDRGIFARSGTLGTAPYQPAAWPGDQYCDWSADRGLRSLLPAGPSLGLTGISAWGPDIAGLVDWRDRGAGARSEELWLRWCEYGALNPIMRDHMAFKYQAKPPVDMWSSKRTKDTFREYAGLHLSLFPYLYSLAVTAQQKGWPVIRALMVEFPESPEAWWISDQYLLGHALLVAPVYRPGAERRRVWFPPGTWVSWWDNSTYEGPSWVEVAAPLGRIPLFQRQGVSISLLRDADARLSWPLDAAKVSEKSV